MTHLSPCTSQVSYALLHLVVMVFAFYCLLYFRKDHREESGPIHGGSVSYTHSQYGSSTKSTSAQSTSERYWKMTLAEGKLYVDLLN